MGLRRILDTGLIAGSLALASCGGDDGVKPPTEQEPSLTQTFQRTRDLALKHTLNFQNIPSLSSEILKGDSVVWSGNVTNSNYSRTFELMLKGQYTATSSGGGITKTSNAEIPNYMPVIDESCINTDLIQGSTTATVSSLEGCVSDINFEDNPSISGVNSLDGKVSISYQGNQISMTPVGNNFGGFSYEVKAGDQETGVTTFTGTGSIMPLNSFRVSGQIQDNITNLKASGRLNVYQGSMSDDNFLGRVDALDGNFEFLTSEEIQGPLILEVTQTGSPTKDYTRIISIPIQDTLGLVIRTHRLSIEDISKADFRQHMFETNPHFVKWDLTKLKGAEIFDENPYENPSGRGGLTREQQDSIEILFRENLGCYTGNHPAIVPEDFYIQKDTVGSERHHFRDWIFITGDTMIGWAGSAVTPFDSNGVIYTSKISLNYLRINPRAKDRVFSHEQGHTFIATSGIRGSHAQTLQSPMTVMGGGGPPISNGGPADCEAGYVLYEDNYIAGGTDLYENPYDEILRIDFNESLLGTLKIIIVQN